ncbi:MAG: rRNA maturation RNase YbeY [Deltaproteobacteria bacterium RIFCSPLOWO2_12_FULL_60_19]|nr:MAG: rRNA maturation RNase YbeY [Deltaproteobacteria bacterium RIFCSPLOWO2_12_FULL_60_19]
MTVDVLKRVAGRKVSAANVKRTAQKILRLVGQNNAELSLALVGNDEIRELNRKYRNKPTPTDVLSFPADESAGLHARLLGDVIISVEQAEIQAKQARRTLEAEVEWLLIHGILHLLGYDHERSAKEAKIMRALEKKITRAL